MKIILGTTPAQRAVLKNLVEGREITEGLNSQSEHGGFEGTLRSMVKRGWVTWDGMLLDAGREKWLAVEARRDRKRERPNL